MAVNLIDNNFKDIETGKTLMDSLKEIDIPKYKKWYKRYGIDTPLYDILWITDMKDKIYKDINDSDLMDSSKRLEFEGLARILLAINKTRYKKYAKALFVESKEIQKQINNEKGNQQMTEEDKKTYIDYKTIVDIRDRLPDNNRDEHMKKLVLSLNTYIPPLRVNIPTMLIWKKDELPPNDNNNYLWVHSNGDINFVINYDKITRYNDKNMELLPLNDYRFMEGTKMKKILLDSIERYPRKYVIEKNEGQSMTPQEYYYFLRRAAHWPITQTMLRKAYVNHYYNISPKMNINEKKLLAKHMRHTISTATLNYESVNI
jgi:hypothetical protein